MALKNKYSKRPTISEKKFREFLRYFSSDLNTSQITKLTESNCNTVNQYLKEIQTNVA